jgi:hypothetical protein
MVRTVVRRHPPPPPPRPAPLPRTPMPAEVVDEMHQYLRIDGELGTVGALRELGRAYQEVGRAGNGDGRGEVEGQNQGYAGKGRGKEDQVSTECVFKRMDLTTGSSRPVIFQNQLRKKSQQQAVSLQRDRLLSQIRAETSPPPFGGKILPSPLRSPYPSRLFNPTHSCRHNGRSMLPRD